MKRILSIALLIISTCILSAEETKNHDLVVAQDGSGDFITIQEAVFSLRGMMAQRKTIFIKKGIYKEKIVIPTWTLNISLIGEDKDSTIITWDDIANMPGPGTEKIMGTFRTYTLLVQGHGFIAKNLTIENNANHVKKHGQAVALHVEGDKAIFVNCNILGDQDTIFAGSETSRQLYKDCYIEGTTDFIFGPSTAYFQACTIHCKKDSYITAPSTPKYKEFGFIFNQCNITADSTVTKVYLGRPWRPYGNSVFVDCELGGFIRAEGWHNWRNPENEKTARFVELGSTGPGANTAARVKWSQNICDCKAKEYSIKKVLTGNDKWKPLKLTD